MLAATHRRLPTALVTWLLFVACAATAEGKGFQRMVVFRGTHTFTAKGGRLPAACMDLKRPTPNQFDTFAHIEGKFTFQRIGADGKPVGPLMDYTQAREVIGARAFGAGEGDFRYIDFAFPKLPPNEKVKVDIPDLAVLAEDAQDGKAGAKELDSFREELNRHRDQRSALIEAVGSESGIVREVNHSAPDLLWDKSNQSAERIRRLVEGHQQRNTLQALTVLHGKEFTNKQLEAFGRTFDADWVPKQAGYTKEFRDAFADYCKIHDALGTVFGSDREFLDRFVLRVTTAVRDGRPLAASVKTAAAELAGTDVTRPEFARDMLALIHGVRLSDAQARTLGEIVGADLTRREPRLAGYVLLRPLENGAVQTHTVSGSKGFAPGRLTVADIHQVVGEKGRVIVDVSRATIEQPLAEKLNEAGVYFVRDVNHFRGDPLPQPVKAVRLIMVAKDGNTGSNRAANRQIYGLPDGADVSRIERAVVAAKGAGGRIVPDRKALEEELKKAHEAGERPLVFFHNEDGTIQFADGSELGIEDFDRAFGRYNAVPVSCETFGLDDLSVRTTTEFHVLAFARGYRATLGQLRKGPLEPDELFNTLGREHAKARGRQKAVILVGGTFGLAGVGGGGGYLLSVFLNVTPAGDDEKKDEKKEEREEKNPGEKKEPVTRMREGRPTTLAIRLDILPRPATDAPRR